MTLVVLTVAWSLQVLKIQEQLQDVAELALKLSTLLCPHLPPSQAAILEDAAASSTGRRGGVPDDKWLRVAMVLQHVMPPKPHGCWNPACVNLDGKREADLTTFKCARCRARYCSKACQKVSGTGCVQLQSNTWQLV